MKIVLKAVTLFYLALVSLQSNDIKAMEGALPDDRRHALHSREKEENTNNTIDQDFKEPECAICGASNPAEPMLTLACRCKAKVDNKKFKRQFHLLCIGNWINTKGQDAECPMCVSDFSFSNLTIFHNEPLIDKKAIADPKRKQQAKALFNFKKKFTYENLAAVNLAFKNKEVILDEEDSDMSEEELAAMLAAGQEQQKQLKEQIRQVAQQNHHNDAAKNIKRVREGKKPLFYQSPFWQNKNVRDVTKLLSQEFGTALLNGFIARTLFESDILTDMPSQAAGGIGILLLFAGSNGLLHLINPQRKNHIAKIVASWAAGLAVGGYVIPNRLKKYVEGVKAESSLR